MVSIPLSRMFHTKDHQLPCMKLICMKLGIHLVYQFWMKEILCLYWSMIFSCYTKFQYLFSFKAIKNYFLWSELKQCNTMYLCFGHITVLKCETNLFKYNYWLRQIYLYYTLYNVKLTASLWMTLHKGYHIQGLN